MKKVSLSYAYLCPSLLYENFLTKHEFASTWYWWPWSDRIGSFLGESANMG